MSFEKKFEQSMDGRGFRMGGSVSHRYRFPENCFSPEQASRARRVLELAKNGLGRPSEIAGYLAATGDTMGYLIGRGYLPKGGPENESKFRPHVPFSSPGQVIFYPTSGAGDMPFEFYEPPQSDAEVLDSAMSTARQSARILEIAELLGCPAPYLTEEMSDEASGIYFVLLSLDKKKKINERMLNWLGISKVEESELDNFLRVWFKESSSLPVIREILTSQKPSEEIRRKIREVMARLKIKIEEEDKQGFLLSMSKDSWEQYKRTVVRMTANRDDKLMLAVPDAGLPLECFTGLKAMGEDEELYLKALARWRKKQHGIREK